MDRVSSGVVAVTDGYLHPPSAGTKTPSHIVSEVGEILNYSSTGVCVVCRKVSVRCKRGLNYSKVVV